VGTGDDSKDFALGADHNNARYSCNVSDRPSRTIEHNTSDLGGREWMVMAGVVTLQRHRLQHRKEDFPNGFQKRARDIHNKRCLPAAQTAPVRDNGSTRGRQMGASKCGEAIESVFPDVQLWQNILNR
jgi:hypothetical protein